MKKRMAGQMFIAAVVALLVVEARSADKIDLSGRWRIRLDPQDQGAESAWFNESFKEKLRLPGSLQAQGFGDEVDEHTKWIGTLKNTEWLPGSGRQPDGSFRIPGWLQPDKHYLGSAWYQRDVDVPTAWAEKELLLNLERVHIVSTVWLNDEQIGTDGSLSAPHCYSLGKRAPGTYRLTIRVDNRPPVDVGNNAHGVSDHTQTTWNGIIGELSLEALPPNGIDSVAVYPDVQLKQIRVKTFFRGERTAHPATRLHFEVIAPEGADQPAVQVVDQVAGTMVETVIPLGDSILLWDEFSPNRYGLKVSLVGAKGVLQSKETVFGMVDYNVENQQFMVNGRPTLFRGTLDCATFPLTGYPSMEPAYWKHVFEVCKAHGLNHVRYHSWSPPEVALEEADKAGIYLQCEHAWARFKNNDALPAYLLEEAERVLKQYGNHPSFALHAYGNEPQPRKLATPILFDWVEKIRALDEGRRLYTSAAGWGTTANSDFYDITKGMRVYPWGAGLNSSINRDEPSFLSDFSAQTSTDPTKPYVAHESAQWCVYPDFEEIKKYTGFLKARNLEIFRDNLNANHMGPLARDFLMASGRLQTLCYKYEIEKLRRTPGCGGYQLLGLNDFSGQGTALVGAVDVFWDTKPYTSAEEYRQFNGKSVLLARFPTFVFAKDDTVPLQIQIAHFDAQPLQHAVVEWTISTSKGILIRKGLLAEQNVPVGLSVLADAHPLNLDGLAAPEHYRFELSVKGTPIKNNWDFWVYPAQIPQDEGAVKIVRKVSDALPLLNSGATVLLVPEKDALRTTAERKTVPGFSTIFWNTVWANRQPPTTMGILCDPEHPLFNTFPTDYHSNYQWWYLLQQTSQTILLDGQAPDINPMVRMVDDWFTNRRLGLVLEVRVGCGKLLLSAIDISEPVNGQPVLNQFRSSVLKYMNSQAFQPETSLDKPRLEALFSP